MYTAASKVWSFTIKIIPYRFIRLVLAIWVLLVLAIFFTRLLGQLLPSPFSSADFIECRLPCVLGVTPGETRLDEADRLLRSSKWLQKVQDAGRGSGEEDFLFDTPTGKFVVTPRIVHTNQPSGKRDWIDISGDIPSLGTFIAHGYIPKKLFYCELATGFDNHIWMLIVFGESEQIMGIADVDKQFIPETPIISLTVASKELKGFVLENVQSSFHCWSENELRWQGFLSLDTYMSKSVKK